ncbi:MAG TPA: hypothetical protein VG326_16675 [Tepidisphaeraceae bacterium]|jgi:hypothetical protein|nr:hypothetical protein [Tepidisphaeraceae bacterium]
MRKALSYLLILPLLLLARAAFAGGTLTVELPPDTKVIAATATAWGLKVESPGVITGTTLTFQNLLPETPYDVRLTLSDGTVVQGVNLGWYNEEEAKPDPGPLSDEDRDEIQKISSIDPFYNKTKILAVDGTHDRASVLVQFVRDKDFYAGAGQVIWHVEIYYFKNQHGGWEKISQQNKVIRRERFKTHDAFTAALAKIKFLPALGGLTLDKNQTARTVKIETLAPPAKDPAPAEK